MKILFIMFLILSISFGFYLKSSNDDSLADVEELDFNDFNQITPKNKEIINMISQSKRNIASDTQKIKYSLKKIQRQNKNNTKKSEDDFAIYNIKKETIPLGRIEAYEIGEHDEFYYSDSPFDETEIQRSIASEIKYENDEVSGDGN